jgi:DNA-binding NtrC family response regulator
MAGRVLIVDDDREMCDALLAELPPRGYAGVARSSADQAFRLLETEDFDVVVTDLNLGGSSGIELCTKIVANRSDTPVVVITAFGSMETAIEAIRAGAYDFVTKPFDMQTLALALNRAVQHRALRHEVRRLRQEVDSARMVGELTGSSGALRPVRDIIDRVTDSDASVMITGESGTGKERVARTLHRTGRRKDAPMIAVNCAALPEHLLESELFGHVKGAFTDAHTPHVGLFVQAHGGTLFLDEIGDMPLPLQAKVLRAVQERRVRPVGGTGETPFDVRIITATNHNLEQAIAAKLFREDLFFRLNVIQIELPPLRARGNDILVLAQHFVEAFAAQANKPVRGLAPATAEKLLDYSWPGNVRELRNYIERAVALTRYEELTVEDLPLKVRNYRRSDLMPFEGDEARGLPPLQEMERRYVLRVVESVGGSRNQAAKILGLDRKTLYRRLDRYGYTDSDA